MSYDKNFYPTPPEVVEIMLSGLSLKGQILDPSAGEGDLLDAIADRSLHTSGLNRHYERFKDILYAIEIDSGRQAILRDKGYTVIDADFLTYNGLQYFDTILMNPPFDDGASHLLKAWDVANGAVIRCLINSETLNNAHTQERKRLKQIIERYGWAKSLGQPFQGAGRKTDVFVTLVHLHDTRKSEPFRLDFEPKKANGKFKVDDMPDTALVSPNIFASYEVRYNAAIEAFKELLLARQKVDYFLGPLLTEYKNSKGLVGNALKDGHTAQESYEQFLKEATREAWSSLFAKTKLNRVTTEGVRKDLEEAQALQGVMAFTVENMEALFNQLFLSREDIMTRCVLESFDEICKYYKENREHYEGWATNSAYKVGKRFILPNMGATYSEGMDYAAKRRVADIEKSLSFLSGRKFETITSVSDIYNRDSFYGKKMQSTYFETRFFKKGTMHFLWKDFDLMDRFNSMVAKERWGGIPEKTKAGAYK